MQLHISPEQLDQVGWEEGSVEAVSVAELAVHLVCHCLHQLGHGGRSGRKAVRLVKASLGRVRVGKKGGEIEEGLIEASGWGERERKKRGIRMIHSTHLLPAVAMPQAMSVRS